jgi:hypothetical protein
MLGRRIFAIALATAGVASAHAVNFTNITVTGTNFGQISSFGPNGISVNLTDHFLVGAGVKTVTITYRVDASVGMVLTDFTISPVGVSKDGSVAIDIDHQGEGVSNYLVTAGGTPVALTTQNFNLSGSQTGYDVVTTIKLTGTGATSVNKATIYNVSYGEAVPEPATLAALGLGVAALIRRRRR